MAGDIARARSLRHSGVGLASRQITCSGWNKLTSLRGVEDVVLDFETVLPK